MDAGYRVQISDEDQGVGYKIRQAENQKIPYMIICGEQEQKAGTASVRKHTQGDIGCFELEKLSEILS